MSDDETLKLIRLAICDPGAFCERLVLGEDWYGDKHESIQAWGARAVAKALAGRLLPPVVETRDEWGVLWTEQDGQPIEPPVLIHSCGDGPNCTTYFPWFHKPRTVSTLADGSTLLGPWREVSP